MLVRRRPPGPAHLDGPRLLPVLAGIVVTIATYAAAPAHHARRRDPGGAARHDEWVAAVGDRHRRRRPALALAVVALAVGVAVHAPPTTGWAVATGIARGRRCASRRWRPGGGPDRHSSPRGRRRDASERRASRSAAAIVVPVVTTLRGASSGCGTSRSSTTGAPIASAATGVPSTRSLRTLVERDLRAPGGRGRRSCRARRAVARSPRRSRPRSDPPSARRSCSADRARPLAAVARRRAGPPDRGAGDVAPTRRPSRRPAGAAGGPAPAATARARARSPWCSLPWYYDHRSRCSAPAASTGRGGGGGRARASSPTMRSCSATTRASCGARGIASRRVRRLVDQADRVSGR